MYFGYYEHSLDDKGRLMIPAKLREGLSSGSPLYVLKGFEGCLSIYNEISFIKLSDRLTSLAFEDKDARSYIRNVLGSVTQLNVDKLGRIQIPVTILNKYQISRQVAVIGVGDHFEVWDLAKYNEYDAENSKKFEDVADQLFNKDER